MGTRRSVVRAEPVPVRILHCRDGLALAEVDEIFVAVWRAPASKALFEWQSFCLAETVQRHPNGTAFMCVIEATFRPSDDGLLRASADMIATHQERLRCVGVVVEGEGFRAATTRGVLSGMVLLLPSRRVPVSYLSSVREAAAWIAQHVPIQSVDAFDAGVARVRARLTAWETP